MVDSPDEPDAENLPKRSAFAEELKAFHSAINETLEKRERVPQPMFWAVFNSRLEELKKVKAGKRILDEKLGGLT